MVGTGVPITGGARSPTVLINTLPWIPNQSVGIGLQCRCRHDHQLVRCLHCWCQPRTLNIQLKIRSYHSRRWIYCNACWNSSNPVQFTVDLNWFVPAGTDYNIVTESSPDMVRELPLAGSFTYWYGRNCYQRKPSMITIPMPRLPLFFYNWRLLQARTVTATAWRSGHRQSYSGCSDWGVQSGFSPGDILADLDVTGSNLTWYSDAGGTNAIPDTTSVGRWHYALCESNCDGWESSLLAITVTGSSCWRTSSVT